MSRIIPKVQKEMARDGYLRLSDGIRIVENAFGEKAVAAFSQRMTAKGVAVYDASAENGQPLTITADAMLGQEAYTLTIATGGIHVLAAATEGAIYALTSLYQLLGEGGVLPCVEITDAPRCEHRGFHVDCARHFFDAEEIKKVIEEASLVKLNRFHWHLSDDQGWRVQIDKYPALYEQCGDQYYTKEQMADVVAYAADRGVMVIPEIDMPGHTRAMTAAYPELSCSHQEVQLAHCGGIYPVILCPGEEETFTFVQDVLDEMIPIFTGDYFHIGGDEAPKNEWKKCPKCQARMQTEGLADENALQGYFSRRVADYIVKKYDKKILCWNDSLEAVDYLNGDEMLQYWSLEHKKQLPAFIEKGGKFIYSDMFDLYYDYPAAMSPMKRSYTARPVIAGVDYTGSEAFAGMECCAWAEYIETPETLENRLFPRAIAMAENAWSTVDEADYKDFNGRLKTFEKECAVTRWGYGDPTGLKKMTEKLGYMKRMATGMDPEVKAQTTEAAAMSDEFMALFKEKMMK